MHYQNASMIAKPGRLSAWIAAVLLLIVPARWAYAQRNDFAGRWETTYGIMTLEQDGKSVLGQYVVDGQHCSIEGKIQGRRLNFRFNTPKFSGEGWFVLDSAGGRFDGAARQDNESKWRTWSGTRNTALTSPILGVGIGFTSGASALRIPFQLEDNQIWLQVSVNGSRPLSFGMDTGANSSYPILSKQAAETLGLKLQPIGQKTGGVGADLPEYYLIADTVSFSLPGVAVSSALVVALSMDKANECFRRDSADARELTPTSQQRTERVTSRTLDGAFGNGFFSSFVVEIDYPSRVINLYEPLGYKYKGKGKSLPLEIDANYVYVRAEVKAPGRRPVKARLIVDTEGAVTLLLNRDFAEAHHLVPAAERLRATNECGIGGSAEGTSFEGTLEALRLGDFTLSDPLTFFRHNAHGPNHDGLLGGGALREFKVIFDYYRRRMILERTISDGKQ
jgi:aspartyl protease